MSSVKSTSNTYSIPSKRWYVLHKVLSQPGHYDRIKVLAWDIDIVLNRCEGFFLPDALWELDVRIPTMSDNHYEKNCKEFFDDGLLNGVFYGHFVSILSSERYGAVVIEKPNNTVYQAHPWCLMTEVPSGLDVLCRLYAKHEETGIHFAVMPGRRGTAVWSDECTVLTAAEALDYVKNVILMNPVESEPVYKELNDSIKREYLEGLL